MDNRTLPPLDRFTDHLEPSGVMKRMDETIQNNDYLLGELAKAKERCKLWKRRWTREVMKNPARKVIRYTQFEMDHAEQEAGFWHDNDGEIERQS